MLSDTVTRTPKHVHLYPLQNNDYQMRSVYVILIMCIIFSINPNLKSTVYCTALSHGGVTEWDFAFKQYKTSTVAAESSRLLSAMACSTQPWILSRYDILVQVARLPQSCTRCLNTYQPYRILNGKLISDR